MGRFIVLEGLDGAGTTTQAALLAEWLGARGEVVQTREPTAGPIGRLIRSSLRAEPDSPAETSLPWLFAADRAEHLTRVIEPALARGAWVISDRYYHSSLAYQSLVQPLERLLALNPFRAPTSRSSSRCRWRSGLSACGVSGAPWRSLRSPSDWSASPRLTQR